MTNVLPKEVEEAFQIVLQGNAGGSAPEYRSHPAPPTLKHPGSLLFRSFGENLL